MHLSHGRKKYHEAVLFSPAMPEAGKQISRDKLASRFQWLNGELADN